MLTFFFDYCLRLLLSSFEWEFRLLRFTLVAWILKTRCYAHCKGLYIFHRVLSTSATFTSEKTIRNCQHFPGRPSRGNELPAYSFCRLYSYSLKSLTLQSCHDAIFRLFQVPAWRGLKRHFLRFLQDPYHSILVPYLCSYL